MSAVPARVGVIGGGTMGAGIAQSFAAAGSVVVVVERDEEFASRAHQRLIEGIEKAAARDPDFDGAATRGRLTTTSEFTALESSELVIEAVPEDALLKIDALLSAERNVPGDAWLATNTSSLSVTSLAEQLARPERFCGLHFFNPVPPSKLVEIVLTPLTSPELPARAKSWASALAKTPITVHDAPGFASSRLGLALALEAMRMVEEGVASAADIDTAMVLGYRHASGPLHTTDLVGLDVRLAIAEHLERTLGPRFTPPAILREKVARGELGRKSGQGFFSYLPD